MKQKNYGFILEPLVPEDCIFGSSPLAGEPPINPSANWGQWLPKKESQWSNNFDTNSCVSFGTENAIETLIKFQFGFEPNYSDRFLARASESTPIGNSPKKVADTVRTKGLVPEADWPFSAELKSWAEYMADIPKKLYILATQWIAEYDFRYEYVNPNPATIKEALTHSPLGIAVPAWYPNEQGLMHRPAGYTDGHWCILYGYEEGKYWKAFDSYQTAGKTEETFYKKLAWDFDFRFVYRYSVKRHVVVESFFQTFLKWIRNIVYGEPAPKIAPETPKNAPVESVKPESDKEAVLPIKEVPSAKLAEEAKLWLGKDASPQNLAPQELSCAESIVNIVNSCWPDTLNKNIVSTSVLFQELQKSPRFKGVLDPVPGCIEISPRTATVNGHAGIYVSPDSIASNDSRTGLFNENYTRASWRKTFIQGQGLKAYLFMPV